MTETSRAAAASAAAPAPAAAAFDVVAIGNAIVDVLARAEDAFLADQGITKGTMRLIDPDTADALYGAMGPAVEMSGGSAANTLAGLAMLGGRCAFVGQVADDQLGRVFAHDLTASGIAFDTPARPGQPPTARCLILVTPDGQRTMSTDLGASQYLPPAAIDETQLASGAILYLEGYLWDPAEPRAAMRRAIAAARGAGRKVALTLSDRFVIDRHGADFRALLAAGEIDILFANADELAALTGVDELEAGLALVGGQAGLVVVTRGADGAVAVRGDERAEVPAEPVDAVVDTTGAGDLFAAGVLHGLSTGRSLHDCLVTGAVCAGAIIQQLGPRAQVDLKALVARRLG